MTTPPQHIITDGLMAWAAAHLFCLYVGSGDQAPADVIVHQPSLYFKAIWAGSLVLHQPV